MAVLRKGMQGGQVKYLQLLLNRRLRPSPKLKVDGVFGPRTESSLVHYQRGFRLSPDGVCGPRTWSALGSSAPPRGAARPRAAAVGVAEPVAIAPAPAPNARKFVAELGSLDDFVGFLRSVERANHSYGAVLGADAVNDFKSASGKRYLILGKGGASIIDFRHFFAAAAESFASIRSRRADLRLGGSRGNTVLLGVANELKQCYDELKVQKLNSCFSGEDLGSNRLGAEFGRLLTIKQAENSRSPASDALRSFLAPYEPQPPAATQKLKMPGKTQVALEALGALLLGVVDWVIPDAY